ncbi:MAG TPA: methionyl-tRNA formyltransferase [Actinomycetota bacterium]|nr:methionyl-tRNA formyltransferase [Actinomycetota bacterium]
MRVAFLGNDTWSVPSLRALADADDVEVALVVTNPPRPAGRGSKLTPTDVAVAAGELGLPLLEVEGVREGEGFDALDRLEPDALVVVAYGEILSPAVLDIPRLGAVNVHFSLLPRWRGAAPVQHAILAGDDVTGVTVMLMDEGMDTGPILLSQETPIDPEEDAGTLGARLAELGSPLLVHALRELEAGSLEPRSQDHTAATDAPKLKPEDRTIDWTRPADEVVRKVRAFAPEPGAVTSFRGTGLKILRAETFEIGGWVLTSPPRLAHIGIHADGSVSVGAAGPSGVWLRQVAPAGRKRMSGAEWARGARLQPHDVVG